MFLYVLYASKRSFNIEYYCNQTSKIIIYKENVYFGFGVDVYFRLWCHFKLAADKKLYYLLNVCIRFFLHFWSGCFRFSYAKRNWYHKVRWSKLEQGAEIIDAFPTEPNGETIMIIFEMFENCISQFELINWFGQIVNQHAMAWCRSWEYSLFCAFFLSSGLNMQFEYVHWHYGMGTAQHWFIHQIIFDKYSATYILQKGTQILRRILCIRNTISIAISWNKCLPHSNIGYRVEWSFSSVKWSSSSLSSHRETHFISRVQC